MSALDGSDVDQPETPNETALDRSAWGRRVGEVVIWHGGVRVFSLLSAIWAARCLGPHNLGISGMVQASCLQLSLLINLNQDNALIREFKTEKSLDRQRRLIDEAISYRLFACLAIALTGLGICFFVELDPAWRVAAAAGIPLLLLNVNQPLWLLQARDKTVVNYRLGGAQAAVILLLYVAFIRPGAAAGSDIIMHIVGSGLAVAFGWKFALHGLGVRITPQNAWRMLRRIWHGRWMAIAGIAIYVYTASSLPLLGYLGQLDEVGEYRTAVSVANVLQQLIALMFVFLYPKFIDWQHRDPLLLWRRQLQIARVLTILLLPIVAMAFLVLPTVYPVLFGLEYASAALPCAILIAKKYMVAMNSIFAFGLWAQSRDRALALLTVSVAVFSLTANLWAIPRFGMIGGASVDTLCEAIILMVGFWLACRQSSLHHAGR